MSGRASGIKLSSKGSGDTAIHSRQSNQHVQATV